MKDWGKVKLGTILTESKVISTKPSTAKRLRVKLNVLGVEKRPVTKEKKGATKYYTRKAGQFIYGKQNLHKGAFGIVPKELDGFESSLDIPAFDIHDSCYPEWVFYFFKKGDFYLKLEALAKGVGSKRIHPKQIYALDIYLPSKKEQKKILEEIEKVEKTNRELVEEITSQERNLINLRQSILQDAVQGKLTKEWRYDKTQDKIEISELEELRKIYQQKASMERGQKSFNYKPGVNIDVGGKSKGVDALFELPKAWIWTSLGQISWSINDGPHFSPNYVPEGIPILSTRNVSFNNGLDFSTAKYVSLEDHIEFTKRGMPRVGDVILTKGGTTGIPCVVETTERFGIWVHLALIKVIKEFVNPYYLRLALASPLVYKQSQEQTHGIGNKDLGLTRMIYFAIPLPPFEEQTEIVKKANQLLDNCEVLKQEIKASKGNAEKLMQSVLIELLGEENNVLVNKPNSRKEETKPSREIKYNSKTVLMDLVKLLKENGKLHAEDLWKMSKYPNDIDAFYSELKKQIEEVKSIKEVANRKGYLELA
ncbi:restriction endonuclease subunit S [Spongiimicrobium sp. 3-5]|uniref:restriction endonuclease subunit S n=1 Tax=Spongiimicrobium sp. 3-5 TaxID=3332596 RepID=UPI00397EB1B2